MVIHSEVSRGMGAPSKPPLPCNTVGAHSFEFSVQYFFDLNMKCTFAQVAKTNHDGSTPPSLAGRWGQLGTESGTIKATRGWILY